MGKRWNTGKTDGRRKKEWEIRLKEKDASKEKREVIMKEGGGEEKGSEQVSGKEVVGKEQRKGKKGKQEEKSERIKRKIRGSRNERRMADRKEKSLRRKGC